MGGGQKRLGYVQSYVVRWYVQRYVGMCQNVNRKMRKIYYTKRSNFVLFEEIFKFKSNALFKVSRSSACT